MNFLSGKKCTFKISVSQSNNEICIRKKETGRSSFYKLQKCSEVFEYNIEDFTLNTYSCINFDFHPLCTTRGTVSAVFVYDPFFVSYGEVSLELEIYARKPPTEREKQWETWSSWSEADTSDYSYKDKASSVGLFSVIGCLLFVLLVVLWAFRSHKCDQPLVTANTEQTETVTLPDNPFRNAQDTGQPLRNDNPLEVSAVDPSEDPWKPPDYQSVTRIDQSLYDERKPRQNTSKEAGPDIIEDLDDPPPPYPGI
ncbi:uncharacterized protein LOC123529002 isoform X2 [Mercenaria mercenaria]|nr:uncharacterized protein LOC123529002 isoform X2 [Mercenaria mercenaria]